MNYLIYGPGGAPSGAQGTLKEVNNAVAKNYTHEDEEKGVIEYD